MFAKFYGTDNDGNMGEKRDWFSIEGDDTNTIVGLIYNDDDDDTTTLIDDAGHPLDETDDWTISVREAINWVTFVSHH